MHRKEMFQLLYCSFSIDRNYNLLYQVSLGDKISCGKHYTIITLVWGWYKDILTWNKYIDWGQSLRSIYFFGSIYPVLTEYKGYNCYIINYWPYQYPIIFPFLIVFFLHSLLDNFIILVLISILYVLVSTFIYFEDFFKLNRS